MGNGEWRMENGEWRIENGEWGMENGEWRMENGEWRTRNGEWGMENGEWQETFTRSLHTNCTLGSTLSRIFLFLELRYVGELFNFPQKQLTFA